MDLITSNGKLPMEMSLKEIHLEKQIQTWWRREVYRLANFEEFKFRTAAEKLETEKPLEKLLYQYNHREITLQEYHWKKQGVINHMYAVERHRLKAQMLRNLEEAINLLLLEMDDAAEYKKKPRKTRHWIKKRETPYRWDVIKHKYTKYTPPQHKRADAKRKLLKKYETLMNRNGIVFQWDRRKLMQVAADRGYYSELATAYAIEECLEMPKQAVKRLLTEGKFSWGQVLVLGALFEMTPKEFCDTFLRGYFIEQPGGEWRASFDNIDKNGLLAATPLTKARKKEELEEETETETEEAEPSEAEIKDVDAELEAEMETEQEAEHEDGTEAEE